MGVKAFTERGRAPGKSAPGPAAGRQESELKQMNAMEKLVKRAQKGDKDAFVELMERQKLSMSRTALAILHNQEDAADAISETVLTAFTKLCTLREAKYFKTWLTRVLICNCYDLLRLRQRSVPMDEVPEEAWGQSGDREQDNVIDVSQSLAALGENDRLILTLFYMDDLRIRDIAAMLSMNENTVKSRLTRARQRFQTVYTEREEHCCEASGK